MSSALLASLGDAPYLFVVGKGGVGKTTTAGALALVLADSGRPTHLLSTDPAHSLGDLFEQDLRSGAVEPCACAAALQLEEFEAHGYARRWTDAIAPAVMELIEGGTYLDAEDAKQFLDLALPGVDEVMAALRLVELRGSDALIVVDTAPTGHTLRLLDAGATVRTWLGALRAMAEKADVVASSLAGRPMRLTAERTLDKLEHDIAAFEEEVLKRGGFIVVSTAEEVVRRETERLLEQLATRGLRVAARVQTGDAGAAPDVVLLPRTGARGCVALRALLEPRAAPVEPARPEPERRPARGRKVRPAGELERLVAGELVFFVGKGGVGKSTCAAACALALAESRTVGLFSTDPAGSLPSVLDREVPAQGARLGPHLFVRQIDAIGDFERFREEYRAQIEAVFRQLGLDRAAVLDRQVMESLWNLAPPGIDEIFALLAILEAGSGFRTLVIDSAPTGHFLRLIEMPELARSWAHELMRVLLKYRAVTGLDDMAESLLRFSKQVNDLALKLRDGGRTAVLLVTQQEPVVEAETERLFQTLTDAGIPVAALLLNRVEAATAAVPASYAQAPRVLAPRSARPLVGEAALRAFFDQWTVEA